MTDTHLTIPPIEPASTCQLARVDMPLSHPLLQVRLSRSRTSTLLSMKTCLSVPMSHPPPFRVRQGTIHLPTGRLILQA